MRWRGLTVLTNTPPKTSQRAPGGAQGVGIMEPILSKAAKKLGVDQVELRKINAPAGKAPFGPALPNGRQAYVTSAFVREALDKGGSFALLSEKARSEFIVAPILLTCREALHGSVHIYSGMRLDVDPERER